MDEPLVYRVPEAARLLAIGQNEVRDLLHRGELAGWRQGAAGYWRIPRRSIEDYIARRLRDAEADRAVLLESSQLRHHISGSRLPVA